MARPRKEINQKQFEQLCMIQCTETEIASVLDVSPDTLERWCKRTYKMRFAEVFKEKRAGGRASLRRNQWKLSETNPTMAIWLGKQYLGQTDRQETETKAEMQIMLSNIQTMNDIFAAPVENRNIGDLEE